jgi:putative transposase
MGHKYPNVLVHLVFNTKNRESLIPPELQSKLHAYISGIGKNKRIAVGGTGNHVHVLIALPSDVSVSKAVQLLKANSSRWMGEHHIFFQWQEGYGAFSVSAPTETPSSLTSQTSLNTTHSTVSMRNSPQC